MDPRIQYATTSDGVSIAYYTAGNGEPVLVCAPLGASHLTLERRISSLADWYEHIASGRTLIRFDARMFGLSDRKVPISEDSLDLDIAAVLTQLGIESVDVFASGPATLPVIGLAARRPDVVRKLILVNSALRWLDYFPGPQGQAILALAETDWDLFVETASHARLGWSRQESHEFAVLWRESVLAEDYRRSVAVWRELDVSPLLPSVRTDTVVMYDSSSPWARTYLKAAREIASKIPGTEVVESQDGSDSWMVSPTILRAIDESLGIVAAPPAGPPGGAGSGTAVILFADIVDSTSLTEQMGDAAFRARARRLDEAMQASIRDAGGTAIEGKLLGDGVLAVFSAARNAIGAAMACREASRECGLQLHLGLHAGDVIREANNIYGGAVNIASRIAAASGPGQLLVSQTVRDLARTSAGVTFEDRGEHDLKGIAEPLRLYEVLPSTARG